MHAAAIDTLEDARRRIPSDYDIGWALATMYRDRGDTGTASAVAADLAKRYPEDRNVTALVDSLSRRP